MAARAHTSRAVLYRRWPNRATLILAAMRDVVPRLSEHIPDTGSLRQDVFEVLRHLRSTLQTIGSDVAHGLLSEAGDLPGDAFEATPDVLEVILARAVARGEARPDRVTRRVALLPGDLMRHEFMLGRGTPSDAFLAEVLDEVLLPLVGTP